MKRDDVERQLVEAIRKGSILPVSIGAAQYLAKGATRRIFERYPSEEQDEQHAACIDEAYEKMQDVSVLLYSGSMQRRSIRFLQPLTESRARALIERGRICGLWPLC